MLRLAGEARAEQSPALDSGRVALELWGEQPPPASLEPLLSEPAGAVLPLEASG